MPRYDASQARCRVFTWKEGALSALAHDLELAVERFTITLDDARAIDARFDASSLRVLHALSHGQPNDALSPADRRKIEATIADDVLHAAQHPEIHFRAPAATAAGDGFLLRGELTLCGRTRALEVRTEREGAGQRAVVRLHQPDFGIKPYRAMMGTLRIKPDVEVVVTIPDLGATASTRA